MNQPPQTSKRIVSKGEYVANVGKKSSLSAFGMGIMGLGAVGMVIAGLLTLLGLWMAITRGEMVGFAIAAFILLIVGGGSGFLFWAGRRAVKDARQIHTGIPLTRANTADLPAPESLVRASEEPRQEQQNVLLRAATANMEMHEEQLMRAAGVE